MGRGRNFAAASFCSLLSKMKIQASIDGSQHLIEIEEAGGKTTFSVDGCEFQAEVSSPERNVYLIKKDGKVFEAFVSIDPDVLSARSVSIGGHRFEINIYDPKRLRSAASLGERTDGIAEIKSAMPGKVVRSLVIEGSIVRKGDGILVVEAMKMQNELKSPKDGVVKSVLVAEGDTVSGGDVLAVIE